MDLLSVCRAPATRCAIRPSPNKPCNPCSIEWAINVRAIALRTRNVAAVLVTADLPPFIQPGARIDVTVSSLGDATSLYGGTLILTSLSGVDGQTYAIAQGQVAVSGFAVAGQAETITQNVADCGTYLRTAH